MKITEEQKAQLKKILPEQYDALIANDDANAILDALDDRYLDLLDKDQEPTDAAWECERLRDYIYWDNFHED